MAASQIFANSDFLTKESGEVSIRALRPLEPGSTIVLGVPGGPGISGLYLDSPVARLASALGLNAAVIDLPNHGLSSFPPDSRRVLKYPDVKRVLLAFLSRFKRENIKVIFYGHSLGGVISLDLLRESAVESPFSVIISAPFSDEVTPEFQRFLIEANASETEWQTEIDFRRWWVKIIPAYFNRTVSQAEMVQLTSETYWKGNELYTEGIPKMGDIAADLKRIKGSNKIYYFEGEKEWILPIDNFEKIRNSFTGIRAVKMVGTGHFPMLDHPDVVPDVVSTHQACMIAF